MSLESHPSQIPVDAASANIPGERGSHTPTGDQSPLPKIGLRLLAVPTRQQPKGFMYNHKERNCLGLAFPHSAPCEPMCTHTHTPCTPKLLLQNQAGLQSGLEKELPATFFLLPRKAGGHAHRCYPVLFCTAQPALSLENPPHPIANPAPELTPSCGFPHLSCLTVH